MSDLIRTGNDTNISLWRDNWCGQSLASLIKIPWDRQLTLKAKLEDIMHGNSIVFYPSLVQICPALPQLISGVYTNNLKDDRIV